jgi:flavin reductase (DIM6/NTAB) family NADH-FMN oxidoreductase RutF
MAAVPAAVAVVSTGRAGRFQALAATSFTSASLQPPLLAVCLDSLTQTRQAVVENAVFNLSVMERRQEFLAERFAGRAPLVDPAWGDIPHRLGGNGLPILEGCVAWFECELRDVFPAGDHDLVLGEVMAAGREAGEPLLLWDRAFWSLG